MGKIYFSTSVLKICAYKSFNKRDFNENLKLSMADATLPTV